MRTGISIALGSPDRHRLEAVVEDCNAAQKHVWWAAIILFNADRARHARDHAPTRTGRAIPHSTGPGPGGAHHRKSRSHRVEPGLDTGGDVHAIAENILAFDDHVAQMHANLAPPRR